MTRRREFFFSRHYAMLIFLFVQSNESERSVKSATKRCGSCWKKLRTFRSSAGELRTLQERWKKSRKRKEWELHLFFWSFGSYLSFYNWIGVGSFCASHFFFVRTCFAYKPKVTIILILIIVCRGFVCGGRTIADFFSFFSSSSFFIT